MARIPGPQGMGDVVAAPQGASPMQTGAGMAIGKAMVGFGQQMRQRELQAEREAEEARKAADKAKALQEMQTAADDLAFMSQEFDDGIVSGSIDKTKAGEEWQRRSSERISQAMEQVPTEYREIAQRDLQGRSARHALGVRRSVTKRDQQDVLVGLEQTLESAQRLYLTNPGEADQMVTGALESLGPHSGLGPDQIARLGNTYREGSRYNRALTLINEAKRDNRALDKVEQALGTPEFEALDPSRRVQLSGQIEGFRVANVQRAEAEARRREAEQERMLRRAESEFNAAQSILTQGKQLSPGYVEQVTKAVSGTPYAQAFQEALRPAAENAAFGGRPLAVQAQALTQLRGQLNKAGTDPSTEKRVAELQRIHDAAVKDYAADPLPAALERGVLTELAPLSTNGVEGLITTLGARMEQAQLVEQQVGHPVSPLVQQEAEKVGELLATLPAKQRSEAIAQLARTLGQGTSQALAKQIAEKNRALGLAFGAGASRTSAGRYTSELILRGDQAIREKTIKADDAKVTGWRAEIAQEIGDAYVNEKQREAVIEAAFLVRAGLESDGGGNNRQAVNLASGGIVERSGRKVPLPYGMTADEFDRKLRDLTPQALSSQTILIGGQPVPAEQFVEGIWSAPLIQAGRGRYAVSSGDGLATDEQGRPITFEVR